MKNILEAKTDNRLEELRNNFPECFDREGNFNIEKFQEIISPETKIFKDSYGLNWLGKSYSRRLVSLPISTVLSEDKKHNEKEENKNSENVYIKGDNLEVLRHLVSAYSEKVKMIYIDPPYNTGSGDFVYNDNKAFTEKELNKLVDERVIDESEKERILYWIDNSSSSHSAWLTFMFPRLYLSRKLLQDDGVIFISIDENELFQLKLLCDEIFGEENFIGNLYWESKTKSQNTTTSYNKLQPKIEQILMYTKRKKWRFNLIKKEDKDYPLIDEQGKYREHILEPMNAFGIRGRETMIFDINGIAPPPGKQWQIGQEQVNLYKNSNNLFIRDGKVVIKMRPYHERTEKTEPFWAFLQFLSKEIGTAESAKKELSDFFQNHGFETIKPVELIKRLIYHVTDHQDIVLDFFSGSATTAHAVMQQNSEDGGNRKYIMVQLEEEIKENIGSNNNKAKSESFIFCEKNNLPKNITSIGIERIKRAANKIKEESGAEIDYGFKIYSINDVPNKIEESMENFNADTLKFFESKLLTDEEKSSIITTYKVFDGNMLNENVEAINLGDSIGHKVGNILYLIDEIKSSSVIKTIIEKLDSDKDFAIIKIVVYGYSQTEGKYRIELCENIKTYANKKSAKIDVEVRY